MKGHSVLSPVVRATVALAYAIVALLMAELMYDVLPAFGLESTLLVVLSLPWGILAAFVAGPADAGYDTTNVMILLGGVTLNVLVLGRWVCRTPRSRRSPAAQLVAAADRALAVASSGTVTSAE